jgi:hypothetical protein
LGREVFEQQFGLRYIVNLPCCERERDWIAERIDGRVDLRRQSATRAADRLVLAVFFGRRHYADVRARSLRRASRTRRRHRRT